jgi:hypothetical protein
LSEKQGEETDWAFTEKSTGFVLQCDPGTEHTSIQGRIPETRKRGMTKIKNHADLFEVTINHQHV